MYKGLAKYDAGKPRQGELAMRTRVLLSAQTRTHYKRTRLNVTFIMKSLKG